ncbi:unnamed protein product [Protopolystoma xenopodis]|uniref:Uncharacterized protein n=1 Tax=Protopolystoma xenopodis TaxID=117903 RepID=A0A448WTC1_9PLAT|nr:unnamed protein product [Protopolystoma xenopodis]
MPIGITVGNSCSDKMTEDGHMSSINLYNQAEHTTPYHCDFYKVSHRQTYRQIYRPTHRQTYRQRHTDIRTYLQQRVCEQIFVRGREQAPVHSTPICQVCLDPKSYHMTWIATFMPSVPPFHLLHHRRLCGITMPQTRGDGALGDERLLMGDANTDPVASMEAEKEQTAGVKRASVVLNKINLQGDTVRSDSKLKNGTFIPSTRPLN